MQYQRTWWIVVVAVISLVLQNLPSLGVILEDNAYKDIVVSFSTSVSQKDVDLVKLQSIFSKASTYLFHATKRRSYFSEFVVTIPLGWDEALCDGFEVTTSYPRVSEVSIYIQGHSAISTQHSGGCGKRGEVILAPTKWMDNGQDGDKQAREFVQQWAIFRYGVFEEISPGDASNCFSQNGNSWHPIGCYNSETNVTMALKSDGLPSCSIPDDFTERAELTSSIMYNVDSPNMTNFCDGSKSHPHNPLSGTRHNILCGRRPVWRVIETTEDFKYGANAPISDSSFLPKTTLKCVYEQPPTLHFLVQNASTIDITTIVTEIRYSLLRFVLYSLSPSTKVAVTTFSDAVWTDRSDTVPLDVTDHGSVKTVLQEYIRVIDKVTDVCLICGLRKIKHILEVNKTANPIVSMIVLASALGGTNSQDLYKELQELYSKLFIFVIEDVPITPVAGDVAKTISRNGGLFYLPIDPTLLNSKLNVDLVKVLRSSFHLEDDAIIVHQSMFPNVVSNIEDAFFLDTKLQGEFVYTLKCNHADRLDLKGSGCTDLTDLKDGGYQCGLIGTLKATNESRSFWKFEFKYLGGIKTLTCSSLATVRLPIGQKNPITFRGWLNHYEVRPGENALVMYAELLRNFMVIPEARVEAVINTPDGSLVTMELRDNGNGDPDVRRGDGIYSRYFSAFTVKGVYSVIFKAYLPWLQFSDTPVVADGGKQSLSYTRITAVNSFVVTENAPSMDIYPPNRIADLEVISVDHDRGVATLRWTAPGDDYDHGQALSYEVKHSRSWLSLTEEGFQVLTSNPDEFSENPNISGSIERRQFEFPLVQEDSLYFMGMRSLDKEGNPSKVSNIVTVFIRGKSIESTTSTETIVTTSAVPVTRISTISIDNSSIETSGNTTLVTASTTEITTTEVCPTTDCPKADHIVVLASSISGGCLFLIILINIIICFVCIKKRPKKLTKRDSMLPPHNTSIAYRETVAKTQDDVTEDDNLPDDSGRYCFLSPPVDAAITSDSSRAPTPSHREYEEYRNRFELATAVPAYVTSSLTDINPLDAEESTFPIYNQSPRGTVAMDDSADDAEIYHLGLV